MKSNLKINNTALKIHVDGVHLKIRSKYNFSMNQYRAGDFECDVCNRVKYFIDLSNFFINIYLLILDPHQQNYIESTQE